MIVADDVEVRARSDAQVSSVTSSSPQRPSLQRDMSSYWALPIRKNSRELSLERCLEELLELESQNMEGSPRYKFLSTLILSVVHAIMGLSDQDLDEAFLTDIKILGRSPLFLRDVDLKKRCIHVLAKNINNHTLSSPLAIETLSELIERMNQSSEALEGNDQVRITNILEKYLEKHTHIGPESSLEASAVLNTTHHLLSALLSKGIEVPQSICVSLSQRLSLLKEVFLKRPDILTQIEIAQEAVNRLPDASAFRPAWDDAQQGVELFMKAIAAASHFDPANTLWNLFKAAKKIKTALSQYQAMSNHSWYEEILMFEAGMCHRSSGTTRAVLGSFFIDEDLLAKSLQKLDFSNAETIKKISDHPMKARAFLRLIEEWAKRLSFENDKNIMLILSKTLVDLFFEAKKHWSGKIIKIIRLNIIHVIANIGLALPEKPSKIFLENTIKVIFEKLYLTPQWEDSKKGKYKKECLKIALLRLSSIFPGLRALIDLSDEPLAVRQEAFDKLWATLEYRRKTKSFISSNPNERPWALSWKKTQEWYRAQTHSLPPLPRGGLIIQDVNIPTFEIFWIYDQNGKAKKSGKSTLANLYARSILSQPDSTNIIFWIDASTPNSLRSSIKAFQIKCKLEAIEDDQPLVLKDLFAQMSQAFQKNLSGDYDVLIILDGASCAIGQEWAESIHMQWRRSEDDGGALRMALMVTSREAPFSLAENPIFSGIHPKSFLRHEMPIVSLQEARDILLEGWGIRKESPWVLQKKWIEVFSSPYAFFMLGHYLRVKNIEPQHLESAMSDLFSSISSKCNTSDANAMEEALMDILFKVCPEKENIINFFVKGQCKDIPQDFFGKTNPKEVIQDYCGFLQHDKDHQSYFIDSSVLAFLEKRSKIIDECFIEVPTQRIRAQAVSCPNESSSLLIKHSCLLEKEDAYADETAYSNLGVNKI